jgi:hypothetical protein
VVTLAYVIFFIFITIGGFFDLVYLLRSIHSEVLNPEDDGRVVRPATQGDGHE